MLPTSPDIRRRACGLVLLAGCGLTLPALAQERPAFMDPGLAISVEADTAELSQENSVSIYRGNVRLERGPLVMSGNELRVARFDNDERIMATLSGSPARAVYNDPRSPDTPVIATARSMIYTTGVEVLELKGDARIARGTDELSGESVRYEIPLARIQASGDASERVRITITPPEGTTKP